MKNFHASGKIWYNGAERKPNRGKAHYSYECGLDDTGEAKGFAGNNFKMAESKH
uniref:hypothetical protein n=1 Tax=Clostridium sp. NkU-1 TaxID=1095009 RepID=UPI003261B869